MELSVSGTRFDIPLGVDVTGESALTSAFDVSGLAVACLSQAALAAAELSRKLGSPMPVVTISRPLTEAWFAQSFVSKSWEIPSPWDSLAGDYPTADGWLRLHTNAAHHRSAALTVLALDRSSTRQDVAAAVQTWHGQALENAVVAAHGCAAVMRSSDEWLAHPQGKALEKEPLVHWGSSRGVAPHEGSGTATRPLYGVKVLDLTRVIAGPVATRFLAYLGADVLRIDPPWWEERALEPEMTIGKRCARLDLRTANGKQQLDRLLATADILVQSYRGDALEKLGCGETQLSQRHPQLVVVSLDAYGWQGPWARRRGFDSLVQMSCGIAATGMDHFAQYKPVPLPLQALDHATGYLAAAAAVAAWSQRLDGQVRNTRLSLARTAVELLKTGPQEAKHLSGKLPSEHEQTTWGLGERLSLPVAISSVQLFTHVPANSLGSAEATWNSP